MKDICSLVADYLARVLNRQLGVDIFYYTMPDTVDECVVVQRERSGVHVPIQLDASVHYLRIAARAMTSDSAYDLAKSAFDCLSATADSLNEAPGFIQLLDNNEEITASVTLYDYPQWESQDQQSRKVFDFYAMLITKR